MAFRPDAQRVEARPAFFFLRSRWFLDRLLPANPLAGNPLAGNPGGGESPAANAGRIRPLALPLSVASATESGHNVPAATENHRDGEPVRGVGNPPHPFSLNSCFAIRS